MKLSKDEVKHVADLARLDLSEQELELYGEQLSNILVFVDQLSEVDTSNVEPTAQVTGLLNVLREDEVFDWDNDERIETLKQAAELEDGQVKVRKVL